MALGRSTGPVSHLVIAALAASRHAKLLDVGLLDVDVPGHDYLFLEVLPLLGFVPKHHLCLPRDVQVPWSDRDLCQVILVKLRSTPTKVPTCHF